MDDCNLDEEGAGGKNESDVENDTLKKALKKWQDHRPSFAEMHAEDVKRRPRFFMR